MDTGTATDWVPLVCLVIIVSDGNFASVLIITCRKRKELLTVHRSAEAGGDGTEQGRVGGRWQPSAGFSLCFTFISYQHYNIMDS